MHLDNNGELEEGNPVSTEKEMNLITIQEEHRYTESFGCEIREKEKRELRIFLRFVG